MVVRGVPVSGVLLFLAVVSFSPLLSDSVSHGGTFILNFTNPKEDFLFYFRGKKGLIPREYDYRSDSWRFPETDSRITVTKSEDYIQISLLRTTVADEGEYVVEKTTGKALLRRILTVTAPYTDPQLNTSRDGERISGNCESRGGYPEGRMVWHLRNSTELNHSANTTAQANSEGLFDITSVVNVSISQGSEMCCTVSSAALMQNKTTCLITAKVTDGRIRHLLVVVVTFVVLFVFLFMCMKRRGAASEVASGHRSQHGATTEGAVLEAISRNDLANEGPSQYEEAEVDTLLEVETRSDMENGHLP
ncbi:CD276 antigen-like [Latimeria chalumnae]|uniref:CD276 antigen-like n=1 Tax=Latimeria chalumnae TaxID=7897 RepID=UPI00313B6DB0